MMFIHFFNIITYTALATADRVVGVIREKYKLDGGEQEVKNYQYGNIEALIILTMNLFQLYLDSFVLYLILSFTKERANRME